MYTYTKVFNKGSLQRFFTKVLNYLFAKEFFAKGSPFLYKNYRLPGCFAVTGIACSGLLEGQFTSGGLFTSVIKINNQIFTV